MTMQTKKKWEMAKLGEIVIPKGSVSGPFGSNIHSKFFTKDGVPVIRGNNLAIGFDPGRYVDNDYIYLSEKKADELSKSEALPEDIIVTARGTIGQTGIIPKKSRFKKYILSANQLRFRIDRKKANPLFVYYWLASKMMVRTMQNVSVNVGVPNLNLANTRNLQVPLPPLSIQDHIADILSAFDDKIELNNKISRTLEQMAQTIFKEWFVNFKFPGHEKIKMVDSELGKIPEGWEVKSWGNLEGECLAGDWGEDVASTEAPRRSYILRGTDIPALQSGGKGECPARYLSDNSLKRRQLKPGDIVIEISGGSKGQPTGRSIFITQEILNRFNMPLVCTSFCRLVRGNGILAPVLMYLHLDRLYKTKKIWNYQLQSTGISNFQYGQFRDYEFLIVPPRVIQEKIITTFFSYIEYGHRNEKQKLATLRDLLLPKLMSGEIKV